ncbi:MAG: GNAT family N-acetyltransferase [Deltaproteobacteria bacterium]|nr:GNAT family N-acetyltransferase [Deltaproteobacteria bacterium]
MTSFRLTVHDGHPPDETAVVDTGLGSFNDEAAPLHEVEPLACFAHADDGTVVGGAVGRWWGGCAELQQLWVEDARRRQGLGARLVRAFEDARTKGCTYFYVETFSFQAPRFYENLGYVTEYVRRGYPHGIAKHHLGKHVDAAAR